MNKFTSLIKGLRQIVTIFLVAVAFFVLQAVGYGHELQAQAAETLTPEARSFQVEDQDSYAGKSLVDKVEDAADNIVEKLNLNEPLPPSTKKFIDQVQGNTDETTDTIKQGLDNAATSGSRSRSYTNN